MDEAVGEVFQSMLDLNCAAIEQPAAMPYDFSATIGISGAFQANCILEFSSSSAEKLTSALLGTGTYDNDMMADAIGEMCNMIAGGWKRRLGPESEHLTLSLPTFCDGSKRLTPATSEMRRAYAFDNAPFVVTLEHF